MNLVVVGASAGLGRALAEQLAQQRHQLLLVASDSADLEALASDLRIRFSARVDTATCRLSCDQESVDTIMAAASSLGTVDGVLFPLGYSREHDDGLLPAAAIAQIIHSNLSGVMALTAAVLPHFLARGQGLLVFFGSVAAERGRSSNVIYAATKRGLQSFYESIRHRCSATKIRVQYYQLGYIDTAQTFGKRLPMRPVAPHTVARAIVANLNNDFGAAYYPGYWRLIAVALRNTPWFIFRKLRF